MKIHTKVLAGALIALGVAAPSQASLLFTLQESGGNVVASGSGTVNTAGLTLVDSGSGPAQMMASLAFLGIGSTGSVQTYNGLTGPSNFGTGSFASASSGNGDLFGVFGAQSRLSLHNGYQSGNQLSGTANWSGATFNSLGLTPGTYDWTWGTGGNADSARLVIGNAPEPATLALLAAGLAGLARARRQRRSAA